MYLFFCGAAVWVINIIFYFIIPIWRRSLICAQPLFYVVRNTYLVITFKSFITYYVYISFFIFDILFYIYILYILLFRKYYLAYYYLVCFISNLLLQIEFYHLLLLLFISYMLLQVARINYVAFSKKWGEIPCSAHFRMYF